MPNDKSYGFYLAGFFWWADENITQLQVAYDLGAQIIEKHFTHNKKLKGNDHYHAMDSIDLRNFLKYRI